MYHDRVYIDIHVDAETWTFRWQEKVFSQVHYGYIVPDNDENHVSIDFLSSFSMRRKCLQTLTTVATLWRSSTTVTYSL